MLWSNDLVLEFLELYESEPTIWNPKYPQHKDRNAVTDAWKRIEARLSGNFSVQDLKKKKESLMATFRTLASKVNASMRTGSGTNKVYKPDWFAYEIMDRFLHGIYTPNKTNSEKTLTVGNEPGNDNNPTLYEERELEESNYIEIGDKKTLIVGNEPGNDNNPTLYEERELEESNYIEIGDKVSEVEKYFTKPSSSKKRRSDATVDDQYIQEASSFMKYVKEKSKRDHFTVFGEHIAHRLRNLSDPRSQIIIQHKINNILFEAEIAKYQPS